MNKHSQTIVLYVMLGITGLVIALCVYGWIIYLIATNGVDERIREDRQNMESMR